VAVTGTGLTELLSAVVDSATGKEVTVPQEIRYGKEIEETSKPSST
jgi:Fe2+ transport system protein B